MDVCDPDAKTKNIRKLIKLHTGHAVNVSRERMCDITREAKKGNLPMPPLVLTRDKRFLLDSKSPLTQKDYETLYKSNTTSASAQTIIAIQITATAYFRFVNISIASRSLNM